MGYYAEGIAMKFPTKLLEHFYREDPQQLKREGFWLLGHMKRYGGKIALIGILGLTATVMSLLTSVAAKYLIDAVTGFGTGLLGSSAVALVALIVLSLALQAVSSRVSARIHVRVRNEMQHDTYSRILRAGWEALEPYRSGDLLNRLTSDVGTVSDGIINFLPGFLTAAIKFAGAFVIMLVFDPVMAVIALVGVPVTLCFSRILLNRLRKHNLTMKELSGEVMSFQEDSFRNLTSIKAFSITDRFEREMGRLQGQYADAFLSFNAFQIGMSSLLSMISMLVSAACFGWGVYQLWAGNITYGSLTMFLQLAGTLRSAFSSLVSLAHQAVSLTTSAGRILAVEALPAEDMEEPEGLGEEAGLTVDLKQVSFEYRDGDVVLHPFDFRAEQGDLIALTGPSGEGKTTLLRLLLGLIQPCEGQALLRGESGREYALTAGTRHVFAYVPQGNSVFSGTIAHNLRLVAPEASDEELEEALDIACALDFVKQFPQGLNHPLGAGGRGVSEGQAQRLAIARALLRKAPVLLLDEATSGLDPATEKKLLSNLRSSGRVSTCILVTHRSASAAFCNRNYEILHGHVTEQTLCS